MNILEIIGIGAIGILILVSIKFCCNYQNNHNKKFTEKARILISFHPELSTTFNNYLKKENERISESYNRKYDEYDDGYRGTTEIIFGKKYEIFYPHNTIEQEITKRIKELEKNPVEQNKIDEAISIAKENREKYILSIELQLAKIKNNYFDYKAFLNSLFPNNTINLSEEKIISEIEHYFKISKDSAQTNFIDLTKYPTEILYKNFNGSKETGDYFYWEKSVLEKMKKLQDELTHVKYKYH